MKLFPLVLAVVVAMVTGTDDVQHLRGESKTQQLPQKEPSAKAAKGEVSETPAKVESEGKAGEVVPESKEEEVAGEIDNTAEIEEP